jgi:hypothetical protein
VTPARYRSRLGTPVRTNNKRQSQRQLCATNAAAASAPTSIDTLPAIVPIAGTARCQASDNPHRPMTMAYPLGNRNFSGVG